MGQEVKNPLRAQSKYGLMGSSAKTGKNFFEGHRSTFWIKMTFGIGHPPPIHQLQSTCVGEGSRVPNLQTEFNYADSFKSYGIFSDFVVPVVPMLSPCRPCHPHIIPVLSLSSPHYPHSPQKVPMWSPWLWSPLSPWSPPYVVPVVPMLSLLSPRHPCHPRHPHIIPIAPRRSQCGPHGCGLRGLCCLHGLRPMLSPWSPCHPHHPHIIPVLSLSSPHHQEDSHIIPNLPYTHSTYPLPPGGWGTPNQ